MINLYLFAFNNRPMSRDIWKSKFGLDCIGPCYSKLVSCKFRHFYLSMADKGLKYCKRRRGQNFETWQVITFNILTRICKAFTGGVL